MFMIAGVCSWEEIWDRDGEFGTQEKGEVEHGGPGEGSVSRGPSREAVVPDKFGLIAADAIINHDRGVVNNGTEPRHGVLADQTDVWIASGQEIGPRFAEKIF